MPLYYKVKFALREMEGRLLVFATEVDDGQLARVTTLAARDDIPVEDGLTLAAFMNIMLAFREVDLVPVSAERIPADEWLRLRSDSNVTVLEG